MDENILTIIEIRFNNGEIAELSINQDGSIMCKASSPKEEFHTLIAETLSSTGTFLKSKYAARTRRNGKGFINLSEETESH